jgi:hypothetical protein
MDSIKDLRSQQYSRGRLPYFHNKTRGAHDPIFVNQASLRSNVMKVRISHHFGGLEKDGDVPASLFSKQQSTDRRKGQPGRKKASQMHRDIEDDLLDFEY